jgi:hypothetical protein
MELNLWVQEINPGRLSFLMALWWVTMSMRLSYPLLYVLPFRHHNFLKKYRRSAASL